VTQAVIIYDEKESDSTYYGVSIFQDYWSNYLLPRAPCSKCSVIDLWRQHKQ